MPGLWAYHTRASTLVVEKRIRPPRVERGGPCTIAWCEKPAGESGFSGGSSPLLPEGPLLIRVRQPSDWPSLRLRRCRRFRPDGLWHLGAPMTTEDEVRLLELQLADIKRQIAYHEGRPARLVDTTHGIAGKGDSRSSSDDGGGWRPMNFPPNRLARAPSNPLVFQQAIISWRGSSSVNVGLSRDTPSVTDLFAGRSAPSQRLVSVAS
jgi:hypothetical protein